MTDADLVTVAYRIGLFKGAHQWRLLRTVGWCFLRGADPDGRPMPRRLYLPTLARTMRELRWPTPRMPWQAEWEGCPRAVRGWTKASVEREAARLWAATL